MDIYYQEQPMRKLVLQSRSVDVHITEAPVEFTCCRAPVPGFAVDKAYVHVGAGTGSTHVYADLLHELGHILGDRRYKRGRHGCGEELKLFREEVIAWRFAKDMCKPEHWSDENAIPCLKDYAELYHIRIKWELFKILPLK